MAIRRAYAEAGGRRGIVAELARTHDLDRATIWRLVHQYIHPPVPDPHHKRRRIDKLTPARRATLLARYAVEEPAPALSHAYGVSVRYIRALWLERRQGRARQPAPRPERDTKHCPECGAERPLTDFNRDRARADSRTVWCGHAWPTPNGSGGSGRR